MTNYRSPFRDRKRQREHEPHGWFRSRKLAARLPGFVLVECPCGWLGWIGEAVAPPFAGGKLSVDTRTA